MTQYKRKRQEYTGSQEHITTSPFQCWECIQKCFFESIMAREIYGKDLKFLPIERTTEGTAGFQSLHQPLDPATFLRAMESVWHDGTAWEKEVSFGSNHACLPSDPLPKIECLWICFLQLPLSVFIPSMPNSCFSSSLGTASKGYSYSQMSRLVSKRYCSFGFNILSLPGLAAGLNLYM